MRSGVRLGGGGGGPVSPYLASKHRWESSAASFSTAWGAQPRDSGAIVSKTPLKQARNKNALATAIELSTAPERPFRTKSVVFCYRRTFYYAYRFPASFSSKNKHF